MNQRCLFYLALLGLFQQCANIQAPSGGARDITPPVVLSSYPDSAARNVKTNEIVLTFNEYIVLKNLNNQLLVSPPLEKPITHTIKGKKLIIKLNQELRANTTYQFNFGESITDNNEGNVLAGYSLVFSTGPELDSLTFNGKVTDITSGKPVPNCLVMLYENYNDSSTLKESPLYVARTGDSGTYRFKHLKSGYFNVVALADKNSNYRLDVNEEIGAYNISQIQPENQFVPIQITPWSPVLPLKIKNQSTTQAGSYKLIFNRALNPVENIALRLKYTDHYKKPLIPQHFGATRDTFFFYLTNYEDTTRITGSAIVNTDTLEIDIKPKHFKPLKLSRLSQTETFAKPGPEGISLSYNQPIINLTQTKAILLKDSIIISDYKIVPSDNPLELVIKYPFDGAAKYTFITQPGFITDLYNLPSPLDTLRLKIQSADNLGNLIFTVKRKDSSAAPLRLLLLRNEDVYGEYSIANDTTVKITCLNIDPGNYSFRYYYDVNGNRQWDSGDIILGIPPEPVFNLPHHTEVRSKWTVEDVVLDIK